MYDDDDEHRVRHWFIEFSHPGSQDTAWAYLAARALVAVDDSTDRRLGPHRLVAELLSEQEFRLLERVGKVTALQRLR